MIYSLFSNHSNYYDMNFFIIILEQQFHMRSWSIVAIAKCLMLKQPQAEELCMSRGTWVALPVTHSEQVINQVLLGLWQLFHCQPAILWSPFIASLFSHKLWLSVLVPACPTDNELHATLPLAPGCRRRWVAPAWPGPVGTGLLPDSKDCALNREHGMTLYYDFPCHSTPQSKHWPKNRCPEAMQHVFCFICISLYYWKKCHLSPGQQGWRSKVEIRGDKFPKRRRKLREGAQSREKMAKGCRGKSDTADGADCEWRWKSPVVKVRRQENLSFHHQ